MSRTKKQILQELLDLEAMEAGNLGNDMQPKEEPAVTNSPPVDAAEKSDGEEKIVAPKKKKELTEKQREALKKGQQIRDENARKRIEERTREEELRKKEMEAKLVKKAIALKRKELKRHQMLDELSDDETPSKITAAKKSAPVAEPKAAESSKPVAPYTFTFY